MILKFYCVGIFLNKTKDFIYYNEDIDSYIFFPENHHDFYYLDSEHIKNRKYQNDDILIDISKKNNQIIFIDIEKEKIKNPSIHSYETKNSEISIFPCGVFR